MDRMYELTLFERVLHHGYPRPYHTRLSSRNVGGNAVNLRRNCRSNTGIRRPRSTRSDIHTDMGSDCDDAGALAVLHALADAGEARILGVIFSSGKNRYGVGTCDAINTWYGRGDLPLGQYKGDDVGDPTDSYTKRIATDTKLFGHDIVDQAPDLVASTERFLNPNRTTA